MYRHCFHCHADLGENEAVEPLPVGRRLAFDLRKGRLWVICPACDRWNLTPFASRWEALETCERLFRQTETRARTAGSRSGANTSVGRPSGVGTRRRSSG